MPFPRHRWSGFWYEPSRPISLAICRVLFFGIFLIYFSRVDYTELADLPSGLWQPFGLFRALGVAQLSASVLGPLQWLWRVSMFMACIGAATRWSTIAAFGLGLYLIGLPQNIARINHGEAIVVFGLAAMALSRCGDALSVDALLARQRGNHVDPDVPYGEYTWPVRTMWLVIVTIYFAAGVTKLVTSGLAWVTSDNLANVLMFGPLTRPTVTSLGQHIGRHRELSSILAAGSLALELTLPVVLVSRIARRILVPCLYVMQLSIRVLMGPGFTEFFVCGLFWIPWDAVVALVRVPHERQETT